MKEIKKIKQHIVLRYSFDEVNKMNKLNDVYNIYPTFVIDGFREEPPKYFELTPDDAMLAGLISMKEYLEYDKPVYYEEQI